MFKFFMRDSCGIEECPALFAAVENPLLVEPVKSGHQRRVSDAFIKQEVDVAYAYFAELPRLLQNLAFEFAQRQGRHFAPPAESTQKKSRCFQLASILWGKLDDVNRALRVLTNL